MASKRLLQNHFVYGLKRSENSLAPFFIGCLFISFCIFFVAYHYATHYLLKYSAKQLRCNPLVLADALYFANVFRIDFSFWEQRKHMTPQFFHFELHWTISRKGFGISIQDIIVKRINFLIIYFFSIFNLTKQTRIA